MGVGSIEEMGIPEGVRDAVGRRLSQPLGRVQPCARRRGGARAASSPSTLLRRMCGPRRTRPLLDAHRGGRRAAPGGGDGEPRARRPIASPTRWCARRSTMSSRSRASSARTCAPQRRSRRCTERARRPRRSSELALHYRLAGAAAAPEKAVPPRWCARVSRRGSCSRGRRQRTTGRPLSRSGADRARERALSAPRCSNGIGDAMYISGLRAEDGTDYLEEALRTYEARWDGRRLKVATLHSKLGRALGGFPPINTEPATGPCPTSPRPSRSSPSSRRVRPTWRPSCSRRVLLEYMAGDPGASLATLGERARDGGRASTTR